jgi:hypothetical protein
VDRNAEIPDLMQIIAKHGYGIRLVNIYKGLPINYDATIVSIDPTGIHVQCNKYQLACLYLTREVYIIGDKIQGTIHAQVTGLIPARDEAILANLEYMEKPFILRNQIRVEPLEPITAVVQLSGSISSVDTRLADISLNGLGVYLDRNFFIPRMYAIGNDMKVVIPLPDTVFLRPGGGQAGMLGGDITSRFSRESIRGMGFLNEESTAQHKAAGSSTLSGPGKITAQGYIVNLRPELARGRYRLGLHLIQEEKTRLIIAQFISMRQSEIIREFKAVYEAFPRSDKIKTS